jgi:hypothetical protein
MNLAHLANVQNLVRLGLITCLGGTLALACASEDPAVTPATSVTGSTSSGGTSSGSSKTDAGGGSSGNASGSSSSSGVILSSSSSGGSTSGSTSGSSSGSTSGGTCIDTEDIGGADSPISLPGIDDKDVTPLRKVSGILKDRDDADAWTYVGTDAFGGFTNATAKISIAGAEVCLLAKCPNGKATIITKCDKGMRRTEGMLEGCCGTTEVAFDPDCDNTTNDTAQFTIIVRTVGLTCAPYTVEYGL